jgi:Fe-S-cluster-containing hydrogenase component 2
MIGCPVGSIHRGGNGQIVIEDWCIGCQMCAKQCPYGSIQMHDTGLIPESAHGWRFRPAAGLTGEAWAAVKFRDGDWRGGQAPFALDRDFLAGAAPAAAYCFRYAFDLPRDRLAAGDEFKVEVTAPPAAEVSVWLNGRTLAVGEAKKDKRAYPVPDAATALAAGRNVVATRVAPPAGHAGPFFDLRGDVLHKPKAAPLSAADYVEKGVTEVAVVCDLCSTLPGQRPACVTACPHDAAMRVNARAEFPA